MASAWAPTERLVLAQEAVDEKANECAAIPEVLDRLDLKGALVTMDAIACNPAIAEAITSRGGDYLLAVKANQPTPCRARRDGARAGRTGRDGCDAGGGVSCIRPPKVDWPAI